MAWVQRGNYRFYRRSVRKGRRVLTEHYGGADARLAAALDEERRRHLEVEREKMRRTQHIYATADDPLAQLDVATNLAVTAILLAAGYYRHHQGEWRKRRGNL
jgi:hypothetical protein